MLADTDKLRDGVGLIVIYALGRNIPVMMPITVKAHEMAAISVDGTVGAINALGGAVWKVALLFCLGGRKMSNKARDRGPEIVESIRKYVKSDLRAEYARATAELAR